MTWLLVLGPPLGVLLIVLVVAATGGTRAARLDADLTARRIAEDIPGFRPGANLVGADRAAALVADAAGSAIAVGYAMGARIAVRRIGKGELRSWRVDGSTLVLETGDFARRAFEVALPGPLDEAWRSRLVALQDGSARA